MHRCRCRERIVGDSSQLAEIAQGRDFAFPIFYQVVIQESEREACLRSQLTCRVYTGFQQLPIDRCSVGAAIWLYSDVMNTRPVDDNHDGISIFINGTRCTWDVVGTEEFRLIYPNVGIGERIEIDRRRTHLPW
jgi:hypothetical protein